jgi:hypothetical protein
MLSDTFAAQKVGLEMMVDSSWKAALVPELSHIKCALLGAYQACHLAIGGEH